MMKKLVLLLSAGLLASCASTPLVPPDYKGPIATIQETATRVDSGKAKMFFVSKVDGNYVADNSSSRSFRASYGHGNNLTIIDTPYHITAQSHVFKIVGSHVWAMDGRAFLESDLSVSGEVNFSPVAGRTYLVNGSLSEQESTVWIEDQSTGKVIANFKKKDP